MNRADSKQESTLCCEGADIIYGKHVGYGGAFSADSLKRILEKMGGISSFKLNC